jgi:hypothetical protein
VRVVVTAPFVPPRLGTTIVTVWAPAAPTVAAVKAMVTELAAPAKLAL